MARNSEKAMTALARWRKFKIEQEHPKDRRPFNVEDCSDVRKAIRFRSEVVREIAKKITQIQNPGLGEFKLRDLNDDINKSMREKGRWEVRIKQLGGPDFLKTAPKWFDREGREVPGMRGYKYFGAAKDLPGVRDIIEKPAPPPPRRTRAELMKFIDADYYGYMDDDDGILVPREQKEEEISRVKAAAAWKEKQSTEGAAETEEEEPPLYKLPPEPEVTFDEERGFTELNTVAYDHDVHMEDVLPQFSTNVTQKASTNSAGFVAHVPVPSQKDVEEALLNRKKQELLQQYVSENLIQQTQEAKILMGYDSQL